MRFFGILKTFFSKKVLSGCRAQTAPVERVGRGPRACGSIYGKRQLLSCLAMILPIKFLRIFKELFEKSSLNGCRAEPCLPTISYFFAGS
jgi:hypothetical protein